ncbi:heme-binding protein A [[Clostridium] sordellii]|nr:hypothetical protein [Paeniclostridium sordellii]CEQ29989.1 heme-binding protein A [[Clostridium] sordellii] [Paeniclostridium sordellii]
MIRGIRKKLSLFLTVSLITASMIGCSSSNIGGDKEGKKNDMLVIATANDIGDLNAHGYSPMYGQNFLYEGLTTFEEGEVKPALAEKWDVSEDGKEYTFYL